MQVCDTEGISLRAVSLSFYCLMAAPLTVLPLLASRQSHHQQHQYENGSHSKIYQLISQPGDTESIGSAIFGLLACLLVALGCWRVCFVGLLKDSCSLLARQRLPLSLPWVLAGCDRTVRVSEAHSFSWPSLSPAQLGRNRRLAR